MSVRLSESFCHRRRRRLEEAGIRWVEKNFVFETKRKFLVESHVDGHNKRKPSDVVSRSSRYFFLYVVDCWKSLTRKEMERRVNGKSMLRHSRFGFVNFITSWRWVFICFFLSVASHIKCTTWEGVWSLSLLYNALTIRRCDLSVMQFWNYRERDEVGPSR